MSKKRYCQHFKPKWQWQWWWQWRWQRFIPNIESQSNEDDVEFGMHSESETDSESEKNTINNEMLYAINEDDSDDSDVEPVQVEWKLQQLLNLKF